MRWALYVTLSPAWFDPGEVVGVLTPFWVLTAMHDALVKPMPGGMLTPSLKAKRQVITEHYRNLIDSVIYAPRKPRTMRR